MQLYASKNVGQFAPEWVGQFDWIVQYDDEIKDNPDNFAAFANRGLSKLKHAIETNDSDLLDDSKKDLVKAIEMCKEFDGGDFPIAKANLDWANATVIH